MTRKIVRKLRHWKQQYEKNAAFICRRAMEWDGVDYDIGDPIPEGLFLNKGKLENFWEADWIELAEFEDEDEDDNAEAPMGDNDSNTVPDDGNNGSDDCHTSGDAEDGAGDHSADGEASGDDAATGQADVTYQKSGGAWWLVTLADGTTKKLNGKKKLKAFLATLE